MLEMIFTKLDFKSLGSARQTCKFWMQIIDERKILERISVILIVGGTEDSETAVDLLTGDLGTKKLPNLPESNFGSSMVFHDGTILVRGGGGWMVECFQLDRDGTWKEHSTPVFNRIYHSTVTTKIATFSFGGSYDETYEYLPRDSKTWIMGKTEIPGGFSHGCAIAVKSGQEILLIGGQDTEKRILRFDVQDHSFRELDSKLNLERLAPRCAYIPNTNKVMITGGYNEDSTEIFEDGNVTMGSPMNSIRFHHGIGVLTINGEERLAVFGGSCDDPMNPLNEIFHDSVELYNAKTEKWELTDMKLNGAKDNFGFLEIKLTKNVRENLKFQKNQNQKPKTVENHNWSLWSFCNLL